MDRLKNLKKRFNNWVDVTLAELCSAYIKQLAKQTSKKRDNSSSMESLPNNLTMAHPDTIIAISSQDISEKITMEKTSDDLVVEAREWSMNKINSDIPMENVKAIYEEFQEWIDIDEDDEDLEILSLEPLDEES